MQLLDVNILVQAHREDADQHADITEWLIKALNEPRGIAVSELVLSGALRIITHPKIFKEPTPLEEALEFIADFRSRTNVHILSPRENHWPIFMELCRSGEAKGNLIPDAYHAALAIEYGCQWISLDRGFSRFPRLQWRHPLNSSLN